MRRCRNPLPPTRHWRFYPMLTGSQEPPVKSGGFESAEIGSPRPLELLDRQGEGRRRVGHAAELDREVRGGGRVRRLGKHDRGRVSWEAEELVEHDVVLGLRGF